jgi:hypothetical protein
MTEVGGQAIRGKGYKFLLALPFVMMAAAGVARAFVGPNWGTLPLVIVGPAVAAAVGGLYYTLAAGVVALAECVLLALDMYPDMKPAHVAFNATIGVTVVGAIACVARQRRDRELTRVRLIAEAAQ